MIPALAVPFPAALHLPALLISFFFCAIVCTAQQSRPTESQVKAAYIYNFGKFVRWQAQPQQNSDSFDICVLGKNPFGRALETTVAGEKIDGKNIGVKTVSNLPESSHCKILFISSSEENRLKSILGTTKQLNLLTVSDIPGFAERGGMIELVNVEGRIRFEVNVAAVSDAGLTVSSELLKVALKVIGTKQAWEVNQ